MVAVDRFFAYWMLSSVMILVAQFTLLHPSFGWKLLCLIGMLVFWVGIAPAKDSRYTWKKAWVFSLSGGVIFFIAQNLLFATCGYIGLLFGTKMLARLIRGNHSNDIFNSYNESFPQQEKKIENPFSVNFSTQYLLRGRKCRGYINIMNPFRGTLVIGLPGSGKTRFVIRQIIEQHIQKDFSMFIWDFKFDDLTALAYSTYTRSANGCQFHIITFDDLSRSERCNPIDPLLIRDTMDAAESARNLLFGLNPGWIQKQDFWVDSAVNLLTAIIYFLRRFENGKYCTLPHAVELVQLPYEELFMLLQSDPETEALIRPFNSAWQSGAAPQLEGMVAGVTVTLGKLATPALYYLLSGNDCSLDINDPLKPKIICLGSNPQKAGVYGALGSLFITAMMRQLNRKGGHPSSLIFDECATLYLGGIDQLMATARSNKVAVTLAVQDLTQLENLYGKERAAVLASLPGNLFCGQVSGSTAKNISERFGKIVQPKTSVNTDDYYERSVTHSEFLELAVPPSAIASLSSGEFVGMVADDPDRRIRLKKFKCTIDAPLGTDVAPLPAPPSNIDAEQVQKQFLKIKEDIKQIVWKRKTKG